jgi:5-(carboxyamino)imidazole ribonucleotide synthase
MLVLAASNWDVKTFILDKDEHCPASMSCTHFIKGGSVECIGCV